MNLFKSPESKLDGNDPKNKSLSTDSKSKTKYVAAAGVASAADAAALNTIVSQT